MKKFCITFLLIIIIILTTGCDIDGGRKNESENLSGGILRIHIRANSDEEDDQTVKYRVKDAVVAFLTPALEKAESKEEALGIIADKKDDLKFIAEETLASNGFSYGANIRVANEDFPTRVYEDLTLPSGKYDAVIVELGDAAGRNWWCVVYPPLCFNNGNKTVYKSKIAEIIGRKRS